MNYKIVTSIVNTYKLLFKKLFNLKNISVFVNGKSNNNLPIKIKLVIFYNLKEYENLKNSTDIFKNQELYNNNSDILVLDYSISPNKVFNKKIELPYRKSLPVGGVIYLKNYLGNITIIEINNREKINIILTGEEIKVYG